MSQFRAEGLAYGGKGVNDMRILATLIVLTIVGTTLGQLTSVNEAEEMSVETGRPIFAVAGQET